MDSPVSTAASRLREVGCTPISESLHPQHQKLLQLHYVLQATALLDGLEVLHLLKVAEVQIRFCRLLVQHRGAAQRAVVTVVSRWTPHRHHLLDALWAGCRILVALEEVAAPSRISMARVRGQSC